MKFHPLFVIVIFASSAWAEEAAPTIPSALHDYVLRPEPEFTWKLLKTIEADSGRAHQLRVTSQKWHDIVWKHAVEVFEPEKIEHANHALLFVHGGSKPGPPDADEMKTGLQLAEMCGSRVVFLHQVPNQPLFGERTEDDLITDTWLKYLDTGDETWPLLFPMVKSAVKTMDAVQELAKSEWSAPIDHFVITGASKRGWASWLTTDDPTSKIWACKPLRNKILNTGDEYVATSFFSDSCLVDRHAGLGCR